MENKQTAVEWLKQQFDFWGDRVWEHQNDLFEQAKAMEKEQIEMAFSKSYLIGLEEVNYDDANKQAEQYYNETYANDTTTGLPTEDSKRRGWHY